MADSVIRVIVTDPHGERWVHLFKGTTQVVSVGRGSGNNVQVTDPRASRNQLVLRRAGREWTVEDSSGRGTTRLNGLGLDAPASITPQDEVTFGNSTLTLAGETPHGGSHRTAGATWSSEAVHAARDDMHVGSRSKSCLATLALARRLAATSETILVRGETGTGKEVLARYIHEQSPRSEAPLVIVNCPGLPDALFESELFGVEKGVATGVDARPGKLANADGGTVLLDEIGDLSLAAQAKILRFLQDRTLDRVGGTVQIRVDVRILAATNVDLERAIESGEFRADLFHRLSAFTLTLPPLRARREDIGALVDHFLTRVGGRVRFEQRALEMLERYEFPGNVRELEMIVRQAALLCQDDVIRPGDLPERVARAPSACTERESGASVPVTDDARLYERVVHAGEDFWTVVRAPFLARQLSRQSIQTMIARALDEGDGSYAGAARLFRVEDEYRRFVDFLRNNQLRPTDGRWTPQGGSRTP